MEVVGAGIGVSIGNKVLLQDVDLEIRPGEVLGLIGPNGAGKTTLLRALAGLIELDRGSVAYDGRTLAALGRRALARRLAYLPQGATVEWPVTVENAVALGRLPHRAVWGDLDDADRQAIEDALQRTGTRDLRHRSIGTLSGGERMRALIARLLAVQAEIILADEPVAALDPFFQLHIMELFAALASEGTGVVLVLHDLALAARYCDRILLLHEGRIESTGTPVDVLTPSTLESVYRVKSISGTEQGQLYVLPWQVSTGDEP
jgi:iron complex transport system ATP-binding protein